MSLTGPPADDPHSDESVQYYPNSIFFLLTRPQTAAIESVCLVIMIVYFLLLICRDGCYPTVFLRPGRARLPRIFGTGSVAALCIGLAISVVRDGYYSRYVCPKLRYCNTSYFAHRNITRASKGYLLLCFAYSCLCHCQWTVE
jgi:hypothetical protein